MSRLSIAKRSISAAAAIVALIGLLSPANANTSDPVNATADHAAAEMHAKSGSIVVTSRLPWLAPVGHRQPRLADVPQSDGLSAWEVEQQRLDVELDRKLIICRGC